MRTAVTCITETETATDTLRNSGSKTMRTFLQEEGLFHYVFIISRAVESKNIGHGKLIADLFKVRGMVLACTVQMA